jgi:hypothetical protein
MLTLPKSIQYRLPLKLIEMDISFEHCARIKEERVDHFVCLIIVLLAFVCAGQSTTPAWAETEDYSGAEYNPSSFRESSFDKSDFTEIGTTKKKKAVKLFELNPEKLIHHAQNKEEAVAGAEEEGIGERGAFLKEQEFAPIADLAGDWAPDKINLTSNGGFSIAPFNGSPVPYVLNGHVDPQRGKPGSDND